MKLTKNRQLEEYNMFNRLKGPGLKHQNEKRINNLKQKGHCNFAPIVENLLV